MDVNDCRFVGRLSRDPEVRTVDTAKGEVAVCNFGLVITKVRRAKSADVDVKEMAFVECEAWDKGGLAIAKHYHKGSPIEVQACVRTNRYTDKQGQNRTSVKFRVNHFSNPESMEEEIAAQPEENKQPF